jgi:hypothetical protein
VSSHPFPEFDPETIAVALFNLLQTSGFAFNTYDRKGALPEKVNQADQPYLGLVQLGQSVVQNQAHGLEKWQLHFRVLVYIRADAIPSAIPATQLNAALKAIVGVMRSGPYGEAQTLGGLVINAWIDGDVLEDTGILDQQCALLIPIAVLVGI